MRTKYLFVALILSTCACLASAQVPKGNAFFGYSYASADLNNNDRSNLNGWEASLEGKFLPFIGIVADFSGHYGTNDFPSSTTIFNVDGREYNFLFGPRVSASVGKIRPFAHVLFGAGHVTAIDIAYEVTERRRFLRFQAAGLGTHFHNRQR